MTTQTGYYNFELLPQVNEYDGFPPAAAGFFSAYWAGFVQYALLKGPGAIKVVSVVGAFMSEATEVAFDAVLEENGVGNLVLNIEGEILDLTTDVAATTAASVAIGGILSARVVGSVPLWGIAVVAAGVVGYAYSELEDIRDTFLEDFITDFDGTNPVDIRYYDAKT